MIIKKTVICKIRKIPKFPKFQKFILKQLQWAKLEIRKINHQKYLRDRHDDFRRLHDGIDDHVVRDDRVVLHSEMETYAPTENIVLVG